MNPTKSEKQYWDKLANIVGCIACRLDGNINHWVSIHHCHGRTKPGCHSKVLPLCFNHHQGGNEFYPSIHPWLARFEKKYGSQEELMFLCNKIIDDECKTCTN
jgi:hypothetical protein